MTKRIAIVNSGGANIASLKFALVRLGETAELTIDPAVLSKASHVILPGVGAAYDAMQRLKEYKLQKCLRDLSQPVLGICLGMQLLAMRSEEDDTQCIGITDDNVNLIQGDNAHPVPHMGWNQLHDISDSPLLSGIEEGAFFYFIHSYAIPIGDSTQAQCTYRDAFSAVIQRDNFFGTQFHPERSSAAGARLLKNFLAI